MAWGRMNVLTDEGGGRRVGSHIRLEGRVLGIPLGLEEVVTKRGPDGKRWKTLGTPRLLVIGPYEMGFVLSTAGPESLATGLTVQIDYDLPRHGPSWLFGAIFGHWYARWCTRRMVNDACIRFGGKSATNKGPAESGGSDRPMKFEV